MSAAAAASSGFVLGVDVGTLSARAGVVDASSGRIVSLAVRPLQLMEPAANHYEYSSEAIWRAVVAAVREAVQQAVQCKPAVRADEIRAIAFDATCSLV